MFLLDTNVVSELRKVRAGKADPGVTDWAASVAPEMMFLSSIVVLELEVGVLLSERRDPATGSVLRLWLDGHVIPLFVDRILSVDAAVARRAAALDVPDPRPVGDGLIAATALIHGLTVVTRNVSDFRPTGVQVLDPWRQAA